MLLILAGVTIVTLTGENGILKQAQNSKEASDSSKAKEKVQLEVLGSLGEEGKIEINNLNKNLKNIEGLKYEGNPLSDTNKITKLPARVEVDGYKIFIEDTGNVGNVLERPGINVGDYVNYEPAGGTYEISKLNTYSGSTENGSENLTLDNMGSLDWQVLRIYDDGKIDLIGSITNKVIYFNYVLGCNNGVYLLNDICKTLYSREGIEARSIKLEDMESWLTDDILNEDGTVKVKGGKTAKNEYISNRINNIEVNTPENQQYMGAESKNVIQNTVTYNNRYSYYPNIYKYQVGIGINTIDIKTTGIDESDPYYNESDKTLISESEEGISHFHANKLTILQTDYDIPIDETNYGEGSKVLKSNRSYWVATRYSTCYNQYACLGIRRVNDRNFGYLFFNFGGRSMGSLYDTPCCNTWTKCRNNSSRRSIDKS